MVQPYQPAVDSVGETAVLCIDRNPPMHCASERSSAPTRSHPSTVTQSAPPR